MLHANICSRELVGSGLLARWRSVVVGMGPSRIVSIVASAATADAVGAQEVVQGLLRWLELPRLHPVRGPISILAKGVVCRGGRITGLAQRPLLGSRRIATDGRVRLASGKGSPGGSGGRGRGRGRGCSQLSVRLDPLTGDLDIFVDQGIAATATAILIGGSMRGCRIVHVAGSARRHKAWWPGEVCI